MKIYTDPGIENMPKSCSECKLIRLADVYKPYCSASENKQIKNNMFVNRPSWCPLRTSTEIAEAKEKEDEGI